MELDARSSYRHTLPAIPSGLLCRWMPSVNKRTHVDSRRRKNYFNWSRRLCFILIGWRTVRGSRTSYWTSTTRNYWTDQTKATKIEDWPTKGSESAAGYAARYYPTPNQLSAKLRPTTPKPWITTIASTSNTTESVLRTSSRRIRSHAVTYDHLGLLEDLFDETDSWVWHACHWSSLGRSRSTATKNRET